MSCESYQRREDVRFTLVSFLLCGASALVEASHQPETWVAGDVWKSQELSGFHLLLATVAVANYLYWLIPPGPYGGVLAAPSLLLIPITVLSAFSGLGSLMLWVLTLHHLPDALLGLLRLCLPRAVGGRSSPARQALAHLALTMLLPLGFLCRLYWFAPLLSPFLLSPLPDKVVLPGLVVHVLMVLLCLFNLRHYWCLVRYCWRYLSGELDELGDPFEVAAAAGGTEGEQSAPTDRHEAHFRKHQSNMKVVYHTIKTTIRLRRKIRRRRAERAAAEAGGAGPVPPSGGAVGGAEDGCLAARTAAEAAAPASS